MQKYALKTFGTEFFLVYNGFIAYSAILECTTNKHANTKSLES